MFEKDELPIRSRLERFRAMAAEAEASARSAKNPKERQEYENLARAWDELIREMERIGGRGLNFPASEP